MRCPTLSEIPPPPFGKTGWPWTEETQQLPETRPDGSAWPRISIVTPSYNQGQFIEETIRSILLQGYPNLEYIIMDGGSTDESVNLIQKYEPWLTYWQSGADGGQAAAINAALGRATGEWFHNINSDDILMPFALVNIGLAPIDIDAIASPVLNKSEIDQEIKSNSELNIENFIVNYSHRDGFSWHQPGIILKRLELLQINGYPPQFCYLFDFAGISQYLETRTRILYLKDVLVRFRIHAEAKTADWGARHFDEEVAVRRFLSRALTERRWRNLADVETRRRRLRILLANYWNLKMPAHAALEIISLIVDRPKLIFDRTLIFFIRRRVGLAK